MTLQLTADVILGRFGSLLLLKDVRQIELRSRAGVLFNTAMKKL
jgi:hypothetical protein